MRYWKLKLRFIFWTLVGDFLKWLYPLFDRKTLQLNEEGQKFVAENDLKITELDEKSRLLSFRRGVNKAAKKSGKKSKKT